MQKMSPNLSFNSLTVSPPNHGAPSRVGSSADGSEVTEAASPRGVDGHSPPRCGVPPRSSASVRLPTGLQAHPSGPAPSSLVLCGKFSSCQ